MQFSEALLEKLICGDILGVESLTSGKTGSDRGAPLSLISSRRRWKREFVRLLTGVSATLARRIGLDMLRRDAIQTR